MSDFREESVNPTFKELIEYLKVLGEGYVKPDLAKDTQPRVQSGVVRETKKYFPYIDALNDEMCRRAGIDLNSIKRTEVNY